MKLAKDYQADPNFIKEVGGEILAQLKDQAAATPAEACPFCGGEAVAELGFIYGTFPTARILCASCKIGTAPRAAGTSFTGQYTTLFDNLAEAVTRWNRRQ